MLRRDTLLVGRVNPKGLQVWGRGVLNDTLMELYESRAELFYTYKSKIYLIPHADTKHIFEDALSDTVCVLVGGNACEGLDGVLLSQASLIKYIKNNSVNVGLVRDGAVIWVKDTWALGMTQKTLLEQWSRDTSHFEVLDNKVYYIKPKQEVVETLYFQCVDIAGSELHLAKSLSRHMQDGTDACSRRLDIAKNIAAFRRFSFSRRETFSRYVGLFRQYLADHEMPTDGLFAPTLAKASR